MNAQDRKVADKTPGDTANSGQPKARNKGEREPTPDDVTHRDRSSIRPDSDSGKARGDASRGKDRPETENEGDYGPGSD